MLYVAYGSNMNIPQMKFRCKNSKLIGVGKLKGWKLVFNIHADIIKTNNDNDVVPIVLWDIANEDWKMLDMYEGFPNYYVKKIVEIEHNEKIEKAIVYVMNDKRKGIYPPFKEYFNTIKDGYIQNNIDTMYLYESVNDTFENQTEHNQYSNIN